MVGFLAGRGALGRSILEKGSLVCQRPSMEPGCLGANGGHSAAPERLPAIHFTVAQGTDQLVNGITLGMLYILVALGLNIILGLMGVINFSHGSFFMLGAYL